MTSSFRALSVRPPLGHRLGPRILHPPAKSLARKSRRARRAKRHRSIHQSPRTPWGECHCRLETGTATVSGLEPRVSPTATRRYRVGWRRSARATDADRECYFNQNTQYDAQISIKNRQVTARNIQKYNILHSARCRRIVGLLARHIGSGEMPARHRQR